MKKYLVFILQGYDKKDEQGTFYGVCEYQLIAKTYKEAEAEAKKLYDKPAYRFVSVVQKYLE